MDWILLVLAGVFEIIWAIGLKKAEGFTKLYPTIVTLVSGLISTLLLAYSVKTLPMGTAYAIWTGIGAAGIVMAGIFFFDEPKDSLRIVCIVLIFVSIVGLKVSHHVSQ